MVTIYSPLLVSYTPQLSTNFLFFNMFVFYCCLLPDPGGFLTPWWGFISRKQALKVYPCEND